MPVNAGPLFPNARAHALYTLAVQGDWHTNNALDWNTLSFEGLAPPIRRAMATVYADILYAETFGMGIVDRMMELAPEGWLREFARVQARDEARHVDFFARVTTKLGVASDPAPELSALHAELDQSMGYEELLLHGQIMEIAARVVFIGNGQRTLAQLERGITLPGSHAVTALVRSVVDLVGRDESLHIAFGLHCLRTRLAATGSAQRHVLEQRAAISARLMYRAFARRAPEFRLLGAAPEDVLDRTWHALKAQLARVELDIGDAPAPRPRA